MGRGEQPGRQPDDDERCADRDQPDPDRRGEGEAAVRDPREPAEHDAGDAGDRERKPETAGRWIGDEARPLQQSVSPEGREERDLDRHRGGDLCDRATGGRPAARDDAGRRRVAERLGG